MSIFDFPRIHFSGQARANVPTGNRNIADNIDLATNQVFIDGQEFDLARPPAEYHQYVKNIGPHYNVAGKEDPKGIFNKAAGYNLGGNNHFSWENVKVTSVQTSAHEKNIDDGLIGGKLALWGHYNEYLRTSFNRARWVDSDPNQDDSSQIYAGQITLTPAESSEINPHCFSANFDCIHSTRWLTKQRFIEQDDHFLSAEFGTSRVFQFSIAKGHEHFLLSNQHIDSECLAILQRSLADENVLGLTVQYALFNMSTPTRADCFVFYDLIGTIGLWRKEELATYPHGRELRSENPSLAPLTVKANNGWLTLNMPATLPFVARGKGPCSMNQPTPELSTVADIGELQLTTISGEILASVPFTTYQNYSVHQGMIDIPVSAETERLLKGAERESLSLTCNLGTWHERDWVCQVEDNVISIEAPNKAENQSFTRNLILYSFFRGERKQLTDCLLEVENPEIACAKFELNDLGQRVAVIESLKSGSTYINFCLQIDESLIKSNFDRINLRVLPDDWHLLDMPVEQVDFDFIYQNVMGYYELVYPFMADKVFSLADQCKCETHARLMWQMCDPANRHKSFYMPSTREMSYSKSMLFLKYLDHVGSKTVKAEHEEEIAVRDEAIANDAKITSRYKLINALKKAIDLELSIMLQYIFAGYSLPDLSAGQSLVEKGYWTPKQLTQVCGGSDHRLDSGWRGTIIEIAHEEMIHYLLINNILMALGEEFYPGEALIGQAAADAFGFDTEFSFEPFSENLLARFIRFEWPSYIKAPGRSIGDFYREIRLAITSVPDLFNEGKTGGEHHLFLNELTNRAFPNYQFEVYDVKSAIFALDFVTEQGEGVLTDSPKFEVSHYNRLRGIAKCLSTEKIPFEPAIPVVKNPSLIALTGYTKVTNPKARELMAFYQACYELMFQMMIQHFAYRPLASLRRSRLMNGSIDIMAGILRPLSVMIMSLPSGIPQRNAAPPVPNINQFKAIKDHQKACFSMANTCQHLAIKGREISTEMPGKAQIELLEFFAKQLNEIGSSELTVEAQ